MARTLLLDLDGTLVDTVPDLAAALNRLMDRRGLAPFTRPETAAMVGDGVAVLVGRALAARGLPPDGEAVAAFAADYGAHAAVESRPYPGIPALLEELAAAGWRLAVCTNKPEAAARSLLQAVGMMPLLRAVGGGDSFPVRKPDPAHLLATLRAAGDGGADGGASGGKALAGGHAAVRVGDHAAVMVGGHAAVMVGDHANDVAAARGAGVRSVFVTWGYGPRSMAEGADAVVDDPAALPRTLDRLVPPGT